MMFQYFFPCTILSTLLTCKLKIIKHICINNHPETTKPINFPMFFLFTPLLYFFNLVTSSVQFF
jgi:hypothetical protein